MLGRLKERFYWPECSDAVGNWIKGCVKCATRKTSVPKRRANLQTLRAGYPMQIVCVILMGPLPETEKGSKYVLVAADCFTKWVEVYGIRKQLQLWQNWSMKCFVVSPHLNRSILIRAGNLNLHY